MNQVNDYFSKVKKFVMGEVCVGEYSVVAMHSDWRILVATKPRTFTAQGLGDFLEWISTIKMQSDNYSYRNMMMFERLSTMCPLLGLPHFVAGLIDLSCLILKGELGAVVMVLKSNPVDADPVSRLKRIINFGNLVNVDLRKSLIAVNDACQVIISSNCHGGRFTGKRLLRMQEQKVSLNALVGSYVPPAVPITLKEVLV